jgi:hypothetical protein
VRRPVGPGRLPRRRAPRARRTRRVGLTALARRVAAIELSGRARPHLDNTLRAWASLPVRVTPA